MKLYCDSCGDEVKVAYPCRFIYHDGVAVSFNVCLDCMKSGTLEIDLCRKRLVAKILKGLSGKEKWRQRAI